MARLVGYRATENFDRPWLSRSLTDLWRRWHISFSFILRDYIFMPLVRRRWGLISALVVTFGICGILHNCHVPYVHLGRSDGPDGGHQPEVDGGGCASLTAIRSGGWPASAKRG